MSSDRSPTQEQRRLVIQRAQGCCEYCFSQACFTPDSFSVEHVVPRARGGGNVLENLALSCQGCNNHKYTSVDAIDPATGESAPLFHPRQHVWNEHFAWNDDYSLIVGITPIGRATVAKLRLNRPPVVNLRRVLLLAGEHPPIFGSDQRS